jgi:hypothetical protein
MKRLLIFSLTLLLACGDDKRNNETTQEAITSQTASTHPDKTYSYTVSKDSLISQLPSMRTDTLDCSAELYWKIIKRGKASIPLLIESLTDTTMTNIYDRCKNGKLNVGEVSYFALNEISEFPAFVVTHIQFDVLDINGCSSFYDYLFDNSNKPEYKEKVKSFYETQKFLFEKYPKKEMNQCYRKYGISGKYKWKE